MMINGDGEVGAYDERNKFSILLFNSSKLLLTLLT